MCEIPSVSTSSARPRPSLFAANTCFLAAAAGLALLGVFSSGIYTAIYRVFPGISREGAILLLNAAYYILFLGLPVWLSARGKHGCADALRLRPVSVRGTALIVLAAVVGVFFCNYIATLWTMLLQGLGCDVFYADHAQSVTTTGGLILYMLASCALPGVFEELLFRGGILASYERRGTRYAVILSAVLFTSLHASVPGLPTELLLGGVIGFLVVACDSLYAGMIYHTVHNAMLTIFTYMQENGMTASLTAEESAQYHESIFAYYGGVAGLISLLLNTVVIGIIFASLVLLFRSRIRRRGVEILPAVRGRMRPEDAVVLAAGIVTVAALYLEDILKLTRVIG